MRLNRRNNVLLVSLILLLAAVKVSGQEKYPDRPITIVAPFPPGGVADLTARPVAAALEKVLKSPVVVVNKTGAAGDSPLHAAVWRARHDTVRLLLARGAPLALANDRGEAPLALAVKAFIPANREWTHESVESVRRGEGRLW
jgi:tripartite-type tricarboxylate transporter receptor subunit TctC